MITIVVSVNNAEAVKLDVDELPKVTDNCIIGRNPRLKNDKELDWVEEGVTQIIIPWHRINYVQVWPSGEEELDFPLLYRE